MILIEKFLNVPSADPDAERRSRLLNILLLGFIIALLVVIVLLALVFALGLADEYDVSPGMFFLCLASILGAMLIYLVGRYVSGRLASSLFIIFLTAMLFLGDDPLQLISGRSSVFFVLPVIIASMLIHPGASFLAAGVIIAIQSVIGSRLGVLPNFLIGAGYFVAALVSWLSAHTLEQVIKELRVINRELDQRVAERTQTLNETLMREHYESSRSRAILQSIADSVMVFSPEGLLVLANPTVSRLTGLALSEMSGKTIYDLMGQAVPTQQQEMVGHLIEALIAVSSVQVQWGQRVLSLSFSPVALESGQKIGTVAVFHDITSEVEVGRMKSAFVAMVSHELRTPLSAILGLIEILQHKLYGPLTGKQSDVVNRIVSNTQKLAQLVEDLLDHAKIEAGTLTIQNSAFLLPDLMSGMVDTLSAAAKAKGLKLKVAIDSELPPYLFGDPRRLNQILTNLVTNAIKYTDQGQVNVRFDQIDPVHWAIEVSDTGIGIAPEAHGQIFDPFWQADGSISRRQGGVGLGLSIVKRLVSLMDGEIRLQSELGVGTTFRVHLPLSIPDENTLPVDE